MAEQESASAFFEEEADEKKVVFSCRILLFEDGSTTIEPEDGFEYSESKTYQTISEIKSWIQAERAARMLAQAVLATPENEQNSKLS